MLDLVSYGANVNYEGYYKGTINKEGQVLYNSFHFYVVPIDSTEHGYTSVYI